MNYIFWTAVSAFALYAAAMLHRIQRGICEGSRISAHEQAAAVAWLKLIYDQVGSAAKKSRTATEVFVTQRWQPPPPMICIHNDGTERKLTYYPIGPVGTHIRPQCKGYIDPKELPSELSELRVGHRIFVETLAHGEKVVYTDEPIEVQPGAAITAVDRVIHE